MVLEYIFEKEGSVEGAEAIDSELEKRIVEVLALDDERSGAIVEDEPEANGFGFASVQGLAASVRAPGSRPGGGSPR